MIRWWVRNEDAVRSLAERRHNPHYLTSVHFIDQTIFPTSDLAWVLKNCDTIIVAVPSAYAHHVIESVDGNLWKGKNIISAIKGILPDSNLLLNDYLSTKMQFPIDS